DELTFKASLVKYGDHNLSIYDALKGITTSAKSMYSHSDFVDSYPESDFTVAFAKEWQDFTARYSNDQVENMLFCKTELGVLIVSQDAVVHESLGVAGNDPTAYWMTFIIDSDCDAVRQMAEAMAGHHNDNGMTLKFIFSAQDESGKPVQIYFGKGDTGSTTKNLYIHTYGSNDAPEMTLGNGTLTVHDDDVSRYAKELTKAENKDTEKHDIQVEYNGTTYKGTLANGDVTLTGNAGKIVIHCELGEGPGTSYVLSNLHYTNGVKLGGVATIKVTDARNASAVYKVLLQDGDITERSDNVTLTMGTSQTGALYGGAGNDTLTGNKFNDNLWGGKGDDTLDGGAGSDRLYGGLGNDKLYGGEGNDVLVGGTGSDKLYGGEGNDALFADGTLDLQNMVADTANAGTLIGYLDGKSDAALEAFAETYGGESIGANGNILEGGAGNDLLFGGAGDDVFVGGTGADRIFGGAGGDLLIGAGDEASAESLQREFAGKTDIELEDLVETNAILAGDSALEGGSLFGGEGDDILLGTAGNDVLSGGAGSDRLFGGAGSDTMLGGAGDDVMYGGSGNDFMYGGAGNDFLDGGAGADRIEGGAGNDLILFDNEDTFISGGGDFDILMGRTNDESDLFLALNDKTQVEDIEVALVTDLSLSNMSELQTALGLNLGGDSFNFKLAEDTQPGWHEAATPDPLSGNVFSTFTHMDEQNHVDATMVVLKSMVTNNS
ncbi:MAG: calcium-binding protein, partial [Desulfovibrio sp.]|nr:calcium-binding protein [Desulfovibrio sp.]